MQSIGEQTILLCSTSGKIIVYNTRQHKVEKVLQESGNTVFYVTFTQRGKRIACAFDSGEIVIYDYLSFEKVCSFSVQQNEVTSMLFVTHDKLLVGQVQGFIDVVVFEDETATIAHSLQIKEAGDINSLTLSA